MAFGTPTSVGSASTESSSAFLNAFATGNASVGDLVIARVTIDNISTTSGASNDVSNFGDNAGNGRYTKIGEYTQSPTGSAADGATVALFYAVLVFAVTTANKYDVACSAVCACKTFEVSKVTLAAGSSVTTAGTLQQTGYSNADAGSQAISGLASDEYLFVRAVGSETDTNGIATPTASYAAFTSTRSGTGGSEKGHVSNDGEWIVVTGTGSTSDPTMSDTTADRASLFIALQEILAATTTEMPPCFLAPRFMKTKLRRRSTRRSHL